MADYLNILVTSIAKGGVPLATGRFLATPVNAKDQPIPVRAGANVAQELSSTTELPIVNGAIVGTLKLPNPGTSDPDYILYRFDIVDTTLRNPITTRYSPVAITDQGGGSWDIATMDTSQVIVNIPTRPVYGGPPGPSGTLAIGTVTTGAAGSAASATITGPSSAGVLNLTIPKGDPGANGTNGLNGIASLPQLAALRTKQPNLANLYNSATTTAGFYVDRTTGALTALANYNASDYIPANSGGSMATNVAVAIDGTSGIAFYDQNFTFVSGLATAVAAGGNFAVPTAAAYLRVTYKTGNINLIGPVMIVNGTALPASFQAFGTYPSNVIDANMAASEFAAVAIAQNVASLQLPLVVNRFDQNRITIGWYNISTKAVDPTQTGWYTSGFIPVIAGRSYTMAFGTFGAASAVVGGAWFDANQIQIASVATAFTNGQVFVAPAGAFYFRFTGILTGVNATPARQMFTDGSTVPTAYIPFAQSAPSPTPATYSTGNGKNIGVLGDSFSAWFNNEWQAIVLARTGANLTFQDSRGKRQWLQALECYGTVTPGAALTTYDPTRSPLIDQTNFAYNLTGRAPQISTLGNTLAQNIATTDLLIIELGENDDVANEPIGAIGDAVNAGTLYGNMRWVVEAYLTAKPTLRIVMIAPEYQTGTGSSYASQQAVNAAQKAFAQSYAIPYLDLFNQGGSSPFTNATYTRGDGTHPNDFNFQNVYAPAVANFLQQWL